MVTDEDVKIVLTEVSEFLMGLKDLTGEERGNMKLRIKEYYLSNQSDICS